MDSKKTLWLAAIMLSAGSALALDLPLELQREGQSGRGQSGQGQGEPRAQPGGQQAAQRAQAAAARQRLDAALEQLRAKARSQSAQPGDWDGVRAALRERGVNHAAAAARTRRFEAMVQQLGRNQRLSEAHVDRLRGAIIDERLDSALARWRNAVAEGKATEQEYADVEQQLTQRAEIAGANDPQAAAKRADLQARLSALRERAKATSLRPEDVDEFRSHLFDARLQRTLADLERRAAQNDVSEADLESVRWLLEDRAAEAGEDPEFRTMQTRLQNALQGLERKLATGQIDSAEFAKLRASFTQKAREASSGAPPKEKKQPDER